MSYKIRNSIALGILLFLIVSVGTYIRAFNQPRKAKAIETEIKKIDEELQNTPNLVNEFNDLSAVLTDTQKRWENRNKDIPPVDITSQSYAYFSHLIDLSGPIKLDMLYTGLQAKGNYGYNVYYAEGRGAVRQFLPVYLVSRERPQAVQDQHDDGQGIGGRRDGEGGGEGAGDLRYGRPRLLLFGGGAVELARRTRLSRRTR